MSLSNPDSRDESVERAPQWLVPDNSVSRGIRLVRWACNAQILTPTDELIEDRVIFKAQDKLSKQFLEEAKDLCQTKLDNKVINDMDYHQIAFPLLRTLSYGYDPAPEKNGPDFSAFLERTIPLILGHCIAENSFNVIPVRPNHENVTALLQSLSVSNPTNSTAEMTKEESTTPIVPSNPITPDAFNIKPFAEDNTAIAKPSNNGAPIEVTDDFEIARAERNAYLVTVWAPEKGMIVGNKGNAFQIQGMIISQYKNAFSSLCTDIINGRTVPDTNHNDVSKKILYVLVNAFDPRVHDHDFWVFAEPLIGPLVEKCIAIESLDALPDTGKPRDCVAFVAGLSSVSTVSDEKTNEETAGTLNHILVMDDNAQFRELRNTALLKWAFTEPMNVSTADNAFSVQGKMIARYRHSATQTCSTAKGERTGPETDDIAYKTLKTLVTIFNPTEHGKSFWQFAEPLLKEAVEICIQDGSLESIPSSKDTEKSMQYIERLQTAASQTRKRPPSQSTPPTTVVIDPVIDPQEAEKALRDSNLLEYLRLRVTTVKGIWEIDGKEYKEALDVLFGEYEGVALTTATTFLAKNGVTQPSKDAVSVALRAIFDESITTFSPPPDNNQDYLRSHFMALIPTAISNAYDAGVITVKNRQEERVIKFVHSRFPESDEVFSIQEARNALKKSYAEKALQISKTCLLKAKVKNLKYKAWNTAAQELLNSAVLSFDPPQGDGDRFLGHLDSVIRNEVSACYDKYK